MLSLKGFLYTYAILIGIAILFSFSSFGRQINYRLFPYTVTFSKTSDTDFQTPAVPAYEKDHVSDIDENTEDTSGTDPVGIEVVSVSPGPQLGKASPGSVRVSNQSEGIHELPKQETKASVIQEPAIKDESDHDEDYVQSTDEKREETSGNNAAVREVNVINSELQAINEKRTSLDIGNQSEGINEVSRQEINVNLREEPVKKDKTVNHEYIIQVGAWKNHQYAEEMLVRIKRHYPETYFVEENKFKKIRIPAGTSRYQSNITLEEIEGKFNLKPLLRSTKTK